MAQWGPEGRQAAILFSFDNLGEAADIEGGVLAEDAAVGAHESVLRTLPFVLDVLRAYSLKSTFCLEAWNADHYPDAVRAIADAGHDIAVHGYRHETWFTLSDADQVATLRKAVAAFKSIGVVPTGLRPPGGVTTAVTEQAIADLGLSYVSPAEGPCGHRSGIAVLPFDVATADVTYYTAAFGRFRDPQAVGNSDCEIYIDAFRRRLDHLAQTGTCGATVCHVTTPLDTPERQDAFKRIVEFTVRDERLWAPTCAEAAAWILGHADSFPQLDLNPFEHWDPRAFWSNALADQPVAE